MGKGLIGARKMLKENDVLERELGNTLREELLTPLKNHKDPFNQSLFIYLFN